MGGGGPPPPDKGPPDKGPPDKGPPDKGLPKPKDAPSPPKFPNPGVEKLTEAQKKTLKEIHEKYSKAGKSTPHYVVHPGLDSQTLDLELK
jgi:hypothetical protein